MKTLQAFSSLVGTVVSLVILAVLAGAAWLGYHTFYTRHSLERDLEAKQKEIVALSQELDAKRREITRLETAMRLLKVDRRVAYLDVLRQAGSAKDGTLTTTFRFTEVTPEGKPLHENREFTVHGDMVHVDALVVKFDDKSIEEGDPLRSTSLCLFKRIYGDKQRPDEAFVIDREGAQPAAYRGGKEASEFERQIWAQFWDYANDAEKQSKAGIRAAHGQGVFQKMVPGKRYRVQLRASDGLSIVPEDLPAKSAGPAF
ncbi:MAG: hypothetical protein NUV77_13265 [Thermoguttaceae bacterium]|nr:hypothetical protein [Thermoguttaceae bacterium]